MADRAKVIKGLEIHTKPNSRCIGCPYPNNGLCGDQLYMDALELLKEQTQWISVKEKLPDRYKTVLTYDTDRGVRENWLINYDPHWSTGYHVTHWMPLPEPPEEEKDHKGVMKNE